MNCIVDLFNLRELKTDSVRGSGNSGIVVKYQGRQFIIVPAHGVIDDVIEHWLYNHEASIGGIPPAVYIDYDHDIAALHLPKQNRFYFPSARLPESCDYQTGDKVTAYCFPSDDGIIRLEKKGKNQALFEGRIVGSTNVDYQGGKVFEGGNRGMDGSCQIGDVAPDHAHFLFTKDNVKTEVFGACGGGVFNEKNELIGMINISTSFGFLGAVKLPHIQNAVSEARKRIK